MHVGIEAAVRALLRRGASVFAANREGERAHECLSAVDNWKTDPMSGETVFTRVAKRRLDAILRPHVAWWWPGFWCGPYQRTDWGRALDAAEARAGAWLGGVEVCAGVIGHQITNDRVRFPQREITVLNPSTGEEGGAVKSFTFDQVYGKE